MMVIARPIVRFSEWLDTALRKFDHRRQPKPELEFVNEIVAQTQSARGRPATSRLSKRSPVPSVAPLKKEDVSRDDQRLALSQSTIRSWASSIQQPQLPVTQ
jgi:hypothetical protein